MSVWFRFNYLLITLCIWQFELAISMQMGDEYVELWHSKAYDPCSGTPPDEAPLSYFLTQMSKYGSKLNPCPLKPVSCWVSNQTYK